MKTWYVVKNNNIYIELHTTWVCATYFIVDCEIQHRYGVHMYTHTHMCKKLYCLKMQASSPKAKRRVTVYMFVVHGTALPQRVVGTRVIDNNNKKHGIKITRSSSEAKSCVSVWWQSWQCLPVSQRTVADPEGVPWVPWNPSFEGLPLKILCANVLCKLRSHWSYALQQ